METVSTRYARTADGDSIAYQVVGNGPIDLVYVPGFISNVETFWTEPRIARIPSSLKELVLGSGIMFHERGTYTLKSVPDQWRLYAVVDDA